MADLSLVHISKTYGSNEAITDFNLDIKNKEFIAIIGPSGCGKTTLLRMISGLETISSGQIYIDGYLANDMPIKDRDIAMVFQSAELYPHMNVYDNLAFALTLRKRKCPLFHYDSRIEVIDNENHQYYEEVLTLYRSLNKKKNRDKQDEIFAKIKKIIAKIYHNKHVATSIQKPITGIDKEKIDELILKEKKIANSQNFKNKEVLLKKIKEDIKYYRNHRVPLFEMRKLSNYEVALQVFHMASILNLTHYLMRKPSMLSGGERQRVALGAAAIRRPKILLMDEPLAHLDVKSRIELRSVINNIHKEFGATIIYVTHDQTTAMTLAHRIAVIKQRRLQQIGTPKEIYEAPNNTFVASFVADPVMNFLHATFDGRGLIFKDAKNTLFYHLDNDEKKLLNSHSKSPYSLIVAVRPDEIFYHVGATNGLIATFVSEEKNGVDDIIHVNLLEQKLIIKRYDKSLLNDAKFSITFAKKSLMFFDAKTSMRILNNP